jgi:hypothetical protein
METTVKKGRDGFEAETNIEMAPGRVLCIHTCKTSGGGVRTSATLFKVEQHGRSYRIPGDYSKTILIDRDARCTEKTVRAQHCEAIGVFECRVKGEVFDFYKEKGEPLKAPLLTSPTPADIIAQQETAERADQLETKRIKDAELLERQTRERHEIAIASEAAAHTFALGGNAIDNLTGQTDIFGVAA